MRKASPCSFPSGTAPGHSGWTQDTSPHRMSSLEEGDKTGSGQDSLPKLYSSTTITYYSWNGLANEKSFKIQGTAEWLSRPTKGQAHTEADWATATKLYSPVAWDIHHPYMPLF